MTASDKFVAEKNLSDALAQAECEESSVDALKECNLKLKDSFSPTAGDISLRQKICKQVFDKMIATTNARLVAEGLLLIRLYSRDRDLVANGTFGPNFLSFLQACSGLLPPSHKHKRLSNEDTETEVVATKCLSNIIFLTRDAQGLCGDADFVAGVMRQVGNHRDRSKDQNVCTLRMLFLMTALSKRGRELAVEKHDCRSVTLRWLRGYLTSAESASGRIGPDTTDMCSEIMKVIFNLNIDLRRTSVHGQEVVEDMSEILRLCSIALQLLPEDSSTTESFHCTTGNAVYSVPPQVFDVDQLFPLSGATSGDSPMLTSAASGDAPLPNSATSGDVKQRTPVCELESKRNLKPLLALLEVLERRVVNNKIACDVLHPLLALLSQLCRSCSDVRRFVKHRILPPRREFRTRPESGGSVSGKLIKLFTHHNVDLKHAVADLLFVLCKEDVDRFVKYTGYGNAAGLLATRGLLAGGRGDVVYSDDSDSDTEEYKSASDKINPVTGHIPPPTVNPMEGMSEEQKEFLAVQLANDISKLTSDSAIRPMCVGADGQLVSMQQKVHEMSLESDGESDDSDN